MTDASLRHSPNQQARGPSSASDPEVFRTVILELVTRLSDVPDEVDLDSLKSDDNLFELGILDSLALVDLITFMEEEFGRVVDLPNLNPISFFTLEGLYAFATGS